MNENKKLEEDTLWSIARLDVFIENRKELTEKENNFWRNFSGIAFEDNRYPGILECQFENWDSGCLD